MFAKLMNGLYRAPERNGIRWLHLVVSLIFLVGAGIEVVLSQGSRVSFVQLACGIVFLLLFVAESLPDTQRQLAGHLRLTGFLLGVASFVVALINLVSRLV